MVLTERALLASSKEKLVPSLDEQVDFIEFMCSVPMLPKEIQRRAITCAVEDVIEEAVSHFPRVPIPSHHYVASWTFGMIQYAVQLIMIMDSRHDAICCAIVGLQYPGPGRRLISMTA